MNLCPYAPNCRRAELCNSPHPEVTERACYLADDPDWTWPTLPAAREAEEERPIRVPEVDPAVMAMIDAALAEPEPCAAPISGELF